jgi:hypothetical protein
METPGPGFLLRTGAFLFVIVNEMGFQGPGGQQIMILPLDIKSHTD